MLTFLVVLVGAKRRLKILVHSYSGGYSHLAFQGRLADLLVEAGHEVHVFIPTLSHSPYNGTTNAQRVIRFPVPRALAARQKVSYVTDPFSGGTDMLSSGILVQVNDVLRTECEEILVDEAMMESLRKENYDMALAETWLTYPFGLFRALGIPVHIGTLTISMDGPLASRLGIPQPPSFVPISLAGTASADRMSYWGRVRNLWLKFIEWRAYAKQAADLDRLFRGEFGSDFPGIEKLVANLSMVFVNANEFFDFAKPWSHKVITIGGIVVKELRQLSEVCRWSR
ncbi:CRE-UGT-49 protein [Aphelenchoides avenae]|nr:CRE-UGT-49 protein [Aphelenchus avenae]